MKRSRRLKGWLEAFLMLETLLEKLDDGGLYGRVTHVIKLMPFRSVRDDGGGAQINLLIERGDNVLNSCEIKFVGDEFRVDAAYYRVLLRRQGLLAGLVSPKVSVKDVLITTFGMAYNEYRGVFSNVVTLDDLFGGA